MKPQRILLLFAVFAVVVAACGSADETVDTTSTTLPPQGTTIPPTTGPVDFTPGELISLDIPQEPGNASPADIARVVAADRAFGLDLLEQLAGDDNLMLSPYSIAAALSMLYPGAAGDTAAQIATALHIDVDDATLHEARAAIEAALAVEPPRAEGDEREPFTIRPANSAWGQGGFPFSDAYLEVLARFYGAGLRVADFIGDAEGSRQVINGWVEDITEDRIKDLIPPGSVNTDTRLVLVNAIWFKASWAEQFDPERTVTGDFTLPDGSVVSVPLMHSNNRGQYVATDKFTAVRLPYAGDAAMVIMLPNEGTTPAELAASLTADDMVLEFGDFQVDLTMPKFEFETELGLQDVLRRLGIVDAFDAMTADLSGITDAIPLYVQDAIHKSFIALDEQGTEAAAATAITVGITSAPPPAEFTADRPFLFWIEHSSTGEMLFLGQVTDPS